MKTIQPLIQIIPFAREHTRDAAGLFSGRLGILRKSIPALPGGMTQPDQVRPDLEWILANGTGLAAVEDGRLVGYLAWLDIKDFRDTRKSAAYSPEWAHCTAAEKEDEIYPGLFTRAAALWAEKNHPIWAMTCLANDRFLETFLYRNGFGMIVQDAVRTVQIPVKKLDPALKIRRCGLQDADILAKLDIEHCSHYSRSPILMTTRENETPESIHKFLQEDGNNYWMAEIDGIPAGFMRFESISHGASKIVRSGKTVAITGAFTRPQFRGRGTAYGILQQALADYEKREYVTCSVDYETINPEAYGFWTRYFQPVCFSVVRNPEKFLST